MQEYDLDRFACQHVGFSPKYKPSRLRQDVEQTVVRPLEQAEFLAPMPAKDRFPKREGRYRVAFARAGQPMLSAPAPAAEHAVPAGQDSSLLKALNRHDLGSKAARDFIAAHPAAYIEAKIDYLDFLIETGERPKKPAGWLRRAIEEDFGPPTGYLPRAVRLRQKQAAEEKQRRKDKERTARRRQEEREAAARKAERAHIDVYLNALRPPERHALEEQAVAHADDNMRQAALDGSPLAEVARRVLVDQEVLRVHPLPASADQGTVFP